MAYKTRKEQYGRFLAEKFKDVMTKDAYLNLKDFEITKIYPDVISSCSSNRLTP